MISEFIENLSPVVFKVVGVGGGACNALDNMILSGMEGVDFIAVNTDSYDLKAFLAPTKIQLGSHTSKGFGAGAKLDVGRSAALENAEDISEHLAGADLVFVIVGMGGDTGTGAAPVVAQLARETGALVIGVVTKPFDFEDPRKMRIAENGLDQLLEQVDSLITISNQNLLNLAPNNMTEDQAFKKVDDVMFYVVQDIYGLITYHGQIGIDLQDVKTIMGNAGMALTGVGMAHGENRFIAATQQAIASLQREGQNIQEARGVIAILSSASAMSLSEINPPIELIDAELNEEAEFICGILSDDSWGDSVRVTVILTNFDSDLANQSLEVDVTIEDIIQTVSDYYEISTEDLLLYDKNKNTLLPRQIAMYLSRTITGKSFPELGDNFGGKDHATIMYACNKIEEELPLDKKLAATVETLKEKIIKI